MKRLKREKEAQEKIRQQELEELERRAQYAAEAEMKRERSEAVLREREITLQKVIYSGTSLLWTSPPPGQPKVC